MPRLVFASSVDEQLLAACIDGRLDDVISALNSGANINVQEHIEEYNAGYTPLITAIIHGHSDIAKELIKRGADRKLRAGNYGDEKNALEYAIESFKSGNEGMRGVMLHLRINPLKAKLRAPSLGFKNISPDHNQNIISLQKITNGQNVYFIDEDFDPYSRNSIQGLLNSNSPKSPMTRKEIKNIKRYTARVAHGGKKSNTRNRR
jgi:ankyrin repeat protein